MKKKISLLLITLMVLSFASCGTDQKVLSPYEIAASHVGIDTGAVTLRSVTENVTDSMGNNISVVRFEDDDIEYIARIDTAKGKVMSVSRNSKSASATLGIDPSKASETALADAGISSQNAVFTKLRSELDDGVYKYEVEFISGGKEYEYELNAKDGTILKKEIDRETSSEAAAGTITVDEAKNIALSHAEITSADATFTKAKFDEEDSVLIYDIEFVSGGVEYEYEIDAKTGAIIDINLDRDEYLVADGTNFPGNNLQTQTANDKPSTDKTSQSASSQSSDLISKEKALENVLADAGIKKEDAGVTENSLDYDDGIAKYNIEFYSGVYEYDYEVNAKTGKIIEKSKEIDDDRVAAQKKAEEKAKEEANKSSSSGSSKKSSASSSSSSSSISLSKAKSIALNNAGVSSSEAKFTTAKKDRDDGVSYYEIEFRANGIEYEYEISMSGKILDKNVDRD